MFAIGVGPSPEEQRYLKALSSYSESTTPFPNVTSGVDTSAAHVQSFTDSRGQDRLDVIVDKIVATLCEGRGEHKR